MLRFHQPSSNHGRDQSGRRPFPLTANWGAGAVGARGGRTPPREEVDERLALASARAHCLARGLVALGFDERAQLVIVCCEAHQFDSDVALAAATELRLPSEILGIGDDFGRLHARRSASTRLVVLACEEGVRSWRRCDVPAQVIGEGTGVLWWKALESRHAEPTGGKPSAPP